MRKTPENVTEDPYLHNRGPVFYDRFEAAHQLARLLAEYRGQDALVAGIPLGSCPL